MWELVENTLNSQFAIWKRQQRPQFVFLQKEKNKDYFQNKDIFLVNMSLAKPATANSIAS